MKSIVIRNLPEEVVAGIDDLRLKSNKSLSREEYLRQLIINHSRAKDITEVENKYAELTHLVLANLEKNTVALNYAVDTLRKERMS